MRIFHVSDCYAPRTGGIESQVRDLAHAQAAAGHEVHVLTATPGPGGERGGRTHDDDGVLVHRLGARIPFDLPVNPAAPRLVAGLLDELRPDVVHVHAGVLSPFAFDGARVAREKGVPLAITWHCMLDGVVAPLRGAALASGWASSTRRPRVPAALSAVSHVAAERVSAVFGVPVEVVPNGMDLDRWAPGQDGATGRDSPAGPIRAVATMRLAPRKRGPALVDVLALAARRLPAGALTLDIIGDGPARGAIERRVARHGLDGVVRLRGRLTRAEVRAAYDDADVFLAPAKLEAFGIAALEARTAGLVVVARRGTGIAEFVTDGVDGLFVDDDGDMAAALVRLAESPELLASMRGRARAERPPFDWQSVLAAAAAEYERAAGLSDESRT